MTLGQGPNTTPIRVRRRWWILPLAVLFAFAGVFSYAQWYANAQTGRIFPGVSIAGLPVGGQSQEQARQALAQRLTTALGSGLVYSGGDVTVTVPPALPDAEQPVYRYHSDAAVAEAYRLGRSGSWVEDVLTMADIRLRGRTLTVPMDVDDEALRAVLQSAFGVAEHPAEDAQLQVSKDGAVTVKPERSGLAFTYDAAITQTRRQLSEVDLRPISLALREDQPKVFAKDAAVAVQQATAVLATSTPTFVYQSDRWPVPRGTFVDWLTLKPGKSKSRVVLGISELAAQPFFDEITKTVNVAAQDAKFTLKDNRVTEFAASQDGQELNVPETIALLEQAIAAGKTGEITLVVAVTPAKITTASVNNLGIRELLGEGRSNFAGSPKNRRHNIKTGTDTLNGILIAPDEDFSLLKALGPVDGEHGYLEELVIKGDRTLPEFGGGLCQIGTSTFRAALHSGLPITERRNHSFRVRYYEPAGMDATIYDPAPDFRFKNDTGYHILFTAAMEGDDLVFRFYGTPDGRVANVPARPTVLSTTPSGPIRYIPSPDLAPGEKKLVEKPAPGGKTTFTYEVTYPDGKVNKQVFASEYRPWPETWLVGATSTPDGLPIPGDTAAGAESGG